MAIEWGIPLLVGGIPTPLQNISQIGSSSQLLGKTKNVPNHQPCHVSITNQQYADSSGNSGVKKTQFLLDFLWFQPCFVPAQKDDHFIYICWNCWQSICLWPENTIRNYWGVLVGL